MVDQVSSQEQDRAFSPEEGLASFLEVVAQASFQVAFPPSLADLVSAAQVVVF